MFTLPATHIGFGSAHMWDRLTPAQREEALAAANKYYAWQALGSPHGVEVSPEAAVVHYFCSFWERPPKIIDLCVPSVSTSEPLPFPHQAPLSQAA